VNPIGVEVLDRFTERSSQGVFARHDHVIETLATARATSGEKIASSSRRR
jgi:hypothetical protein